jgi:hypothetical protein
MDPAILTVNMSMARDHLQLFVCLLFALPAISFISIKCWIAARAGKVQRTTNWFVPTDLDSDAARLHASMQHNSVAFAHLAHRSSSPAINRAIRRRP